MDEPRSEADRQFLSHATALAFEVAQQGLTTVADYISRGIQRVPADDRIGGLDRLLGQAVEGIDRATDVVAAKPVEQQSSLEIAAAEFVRVVGVRVIGAAARMLTGKRSLTDDAPRENVIRILQAVGATITSLVNDSVGGARDRSAPDEAARLGRDIIRVVLEPPEEVVSFGLENVGLAPVDPERAGLEFVATPLIGESHLIPSPQLKPPDEIREQATGVVQMYVGRDIPPGSYRGFVYALWQGSPVALAALEMTVRAHAPAGVGVAVATLS